MSGLYTSPGRSGGLGGFVSGRHKTELSGIMIRMSWNPKAYGGDRFDLQAIDGAETRSWSSDIMDVRLWSNGRSYLIVHCSNFNLSHAYNTYIVLLHYSLESGLYLSMLISIASAPKISQSTQTPIEKRLGRQNPHTCMRQGLGHRLRERCLSIQHA